MPDLIDKGIPAILDRGGLRRPSAYCSGCVHWQGGNTCAAFDRIPDELWYGRIRHDASYPGDRGFRFERKEVEPLPPEKIAWLLAEAERFGKGHV